MARAESPFPTRGLACRRRQQSRLRRWRSALPARAADHAAKIAMVEVWVLVGENVGVDVAEGRVWFVLVAVVEGLDDVFLETGRAGIGRDHGLAQGLRERLVGYAQHVHLDAGG